MTPSADAMNRREALWRTALVLGGVVSAPTLSATLAWCDAPRSGQSAWAPRALTSQQGELVATIAEHIIPETDTPGARSVGVHRFVDTMLAEYYPAAERQRFIAGISDVDARARQLNGKTFLRSTPDEQHQILDELDREAYTRPAAAGAARGASTDRAPAAAFFRTMKELTLIGYYTSEAGATRELKHAAVPGRFEGCVPFAQIGRAWA